MGEKTKAGQHCGIKQRNLNFRKATMQANTLFFWISFAVFATAFIDGGEANPLHGIEINYVYSSRSDSDYIVETNCTSSCVGLADGLYDSCKSCFHFTLCHKEEIQNIFECADDLFWDDILKDCVYNPSTCSMYEALTTTPETVENATAHLDDDDFETGEWSNTTEVTTTIYNEQNATAHLDEDDFATTEWNITTEA